MKQKIEKKKIWLFFNPSADEILDNTENEEQSDNESEKRCCEVCYFIKCNCDPVAEESDQLDTENKIDENTNVPDTAFKCDLCDFETLRNIGLKIHKSKMHPGQSKQSCDKCSEIFDTELKFKSHMYCVHSGLSKRIIQWKIIHLERTLDKQEFAFGPIRL